MDGQARFPRQRSASGSGPATPNGDPARHAGPARAGGSSRGGPAPDSGPAPESDSDPDPEPGCALHRRLHAAFAPADLVAVGEIRHRLRAALSRWGVPELADTAELLTSELVTNALLHTGKGAVLEAVLTPGQRLRIEVQDGTTRLPGRRAPAEWATSGRGLLLVESLADDWGVHLRGDGKVTWFELGAV
ncbi:ATP-binding protein [Kitasatospora sp. NPDC088346]|uniref:ATP-binding protein n=1 Tax=Kitasatospora sp. NPDC088346 TaxID=3364073 RepID=UPI003803A357